MQVGELFVAFGLKPEGWGEAAGQIRSLASAARTYLGVQAVRSIVTLVEHTTEAATHLVSLSAAMGMTVEQTQLWGYVSEQSGSNLKELSVGMSMFIGNLRKFVNGGGSKQFRKDMQDLGLSQAEAAAALADPDKLNALKLKVADHIKGLGQTGNQSGFGRELFGARAGRAIVADMARGSEGLKELFARREKMGLISDADAHTLRDVGNRFKDLHTSLNAITSAVVARLAPTFLKMAEAALAWIEANKDVISGALTVALELVAGAFKAIGAAIGLLQQLFHDAFNGDDGAKAILIGIAAAILAVVVPALIAMAISAWAAMAPFLLIAIAVALVAYAIFKLIKYAPEIKKALGDAWDWVKQKAMDFWSWLTGLPGDFVNLMEEIGDSIIHAFERAWDAVKNATEDAVHYIAQKLQNIPGMGVLGWIAGKVDPGARLDLGHTMADAANASAQVPTIPAAAANVPGGAANSNTANSNITLNITNNGVKDAPEAVQEFDKTLRHTMRDIGAGGR